jgi:hypothetical protein
MTTGPTPALMKEINAGTFLMARGPEPEGRRVHDGPISSVAVVLSGGDEHDGDQH